MVVRAVQFVRKMRGAAQAHLLKCDDGQHYVVKFSNNPQHSRVVINDFIGSMLLKLLDIPTPEACLVDISQDFLARSPEVYIELHSRREAVTAGLHFGSLYPGEPEKTRIYDFLPESIMDRVINGVSFLGALVFDKWTGNVDMRQAVFVRMRARPWSAGSKCPPPGFVASMIDQGYIFGGPEWKFYDSPLQGLYFSPSVYAHIHSLEDFEPWIQRVRDLSEDALAKIRRDLPAEWVHGEEAALDALLCRLFARRNRLPDLISAVRSARVNIFPQWRQVSPGGV